MEPRRRKLVRQYPKEILLSAFARMAEQAPFYIFTAFVFFYGIGTLHASQGYFGRIPGAVTSGRSKAIANRVAKMG
jgi:hypothetical protein